jgi:hypothetical protein
MRAQTGRGVLAAALTVGGASVLCAQLTTAPKKVPGYIVTADVEALLPGPETANLPAGDTKALLASLATGKKVTLRAALAERLSRMEIASDGFLLPAGTILQHQAGSRPYTISDPQAKTFIVMDSGVLLNAIEGTAGIGPSPYDATVVHTGEEARAESIERVPSALRAVVAAGYPCRKSIVTVSYAVAMEFEGKQIHVQRKTELTIWHTSKLVSTAAIDHLFMKFQNDKTGKVRRVLEQEIGFPMMVDVIVRSRQGAKQDSVQPGSFRMVVTGVKVEKELDPLHFQIPLPGFRQVSRNPYFGAAQKAVAP